MGDECLTFSRSYSSQTSSIGLDSNLAQEVKDGPT